MPRKLSPNPPGRPKAFSEPEALDAAMGVFAAKGFEATSLSDLERATGINRVSLYASFGNKEALFVRAFARYTEAGSLRFMRHLALPSARAGVEDLLRESVEIFSDPQGHGVCFVTQAPLSGKDASPETRHFIAEQRAGIERMLADRLRQAVNDGELKTGTAFADMARFFATTIVGMALQVQHGATGADLMRVVDIAMTTWPTESVSSGR